MDEDGAFEDEAFEDGAFEDASTSPARQPVSTTDAAVAARLETRYGGRRSQRRGLIITLVTAAVLVAGGAGVVWMSGILTPAKNVSGEGVGTVTGERSTRLDWELTAPTGHSVECAVDAQDSNHIIVGWVLVKVPASRSSVGQRLSTEIRTTRPAVEAEVSTCWLR